MTTPLTLRKGDRLVNGRARDLDGCIVKALGDPADNRFHVLASLGTEDRDGDTIQVSYAAQDLYRKKKEVIDQSIEILRRRVDETGTIEPTIMRQGDERILLQVPGIKDTTELKRKINQTAKLTFHLVNEDVAASGRGVPASVPPTTMLVPTREGMIALRATTPKAWAEIQAANPKMSPEQICRRFQPDCLPVLKRVIVSGEDLDGKPFKLSEYRGKVVLLDFWGHW